MVRFEDKRLVIVLDTSSPAEDWKSITDDLIDLLQSEDKDMRGDRYYVLELLRQMSPDATQVTG